MTLGNYEKHAAVWEWSGYDRSSEIMCWLTLAKKYGTKALAAMCATGKVAEALASDGLTVTAVDITTEMVNEGRRKYGHNANLTFIEGDICDLHLPARDYDFAFIATTDLHHLLTPEARGNALASLAAHTRPGGCLGLELWYPSPQSFNSPWREFQPIVPPAPGEPKVWKKGKTEYNATNKLVTITQEVFVETHGSLEQFLHTFSLQLFDREDLIDMLTKAGYDLVAEYGSYDLGPWSIESGKWIIEAVKR